MSPVEPVGFPKCGERVFAQTATPAPKTPQVARRTWLLGIGLIYVIPDCRDDALPWLQRSLAITASAGPYALRPCRGL
jgi:hypothetical protein